MLEELLQPYHEWKASSQAAASSQAGTCTATTSSLKQPPFEYTLISSAKPTSKLVRQYVSTGKVPVLLVYHNNNGDARVVAFDSQSSDTIAVTSNDVLESRNQRQPDLILSESSAINTYLADHFGGIELGLIPQSSSTIQEDASSSSSSQRLHRDDHQRAIYDMVVSCITTELDAQGLWIHSKHDETKMAQHFGHIPAAVSHARDHFVRLNAHMVASYLQQPAPATATLPSDSSRRLYLLGNAFTAADILYVHCLEWSIAIGWWTIDKQDSNAQPPLLQLSNADDQQTLYDYYERCRRRPAFQRAAQLRNKKPTSTAHPNSKL
jgi:glutathione S-transferase